MVATLVDDVGFRGRRGKSNEQGVEVIAVVARVGHGGAGAHQSLVGDFEFDTEINVGFFVMRVGNH